MSQLGTYLYKDVIVEVCNIINEGEITSNKGIFKNKSYNFS